MIIVVVAAAARVYPGKSKSHEYFSGGSCEVLRNRGGGNVAAPKWDLFFPVSKYEKIRLGFAALVCISNWAIRG